MQVFDTTFSYTLAGNQLTGPTPSHVNTLQNLGHIYLDYNNVNGTIPYWLYALAFLVSLDLSNNQLIGHIHHFQSTSLIHIFLENNRLNGSIPSSIFEQVNLVTLFTLFKQFQWN